ncbi:MAG: penicillin-binding protein 2 [Armatimonadetes bacterium]|nr:penicillin-binding protein 2 [Armatimonadota bacterium]
MAKTSAERRRNRTLGTFLVAMMACAALSQTYVQIFAAGKTLETARKGNNYIVSRTDTARRGAIFSADDKVLAQSNDTFELSISYDKVPKSDSFFMALSEASGLPAIELELSARSGGKSKTWSQKINQERERKIQQIKVDWRADGLSLRRVPTREYPFSDVADALIGQLVEGKPATGLESSQNGMLSGKDGKREGLVDRYGAFLPMRMTSSDIKAVHGQDLVLTIDSGLQVAATSALKRAVEQHKADQGVVVVIDPRTGDILAMASWVNNGVSQSENGFNPAVMARFEPGSTFKILTLAEGIDSGSVNPHTVIHCGGSIAVGRVNRVSCAHGGHGAIDAEMAIAESCNVSAATWARQIGRDQFIGFMENAGLFTRTSIGLPGEIPGRYNENDGGKLIQLANMGFGQALNVTPIGLCAAFASLGNNGVCPEPRLIKKIGSKKVPISAGRRLFKSETCDEVLTMMRSVFENEHGTAHKLRIPGYAIGGKTGTAEKLNGRTREGHKEYVSNFVGFVPAQNPKAVVLVMIDNPSDGQYYGGTVAGPVFKSVAESLISRFNLPKTE